MAYRQLLTPKHCVMVYCAGSASSALQQPSKGALTGKGAKPGTASGDAGAPPSAAAAGAGTGVSGRPFSCVSWQLADDRMTLASLGWTDADQSALVPPAAVVHPAAAPAATPVIPTGGWPCACAAAILPFICACCWWRRHRLFWTGCLIRLS